MRDRQKKLEAQRRYREKNRERLRLEANAYYKANKESINDRQKARFLLYPEKRKHHILKSTYGISFEEYQELQKIQNNLCKICEQEEELGGYLSVDHCHTTGKIRGLLCRKCNKGLGLFNDSKIKLKQALQYLENNG